MTAVGQRALVGKILFVSAVLMMLAAGLIWAGAIVVDEPTRTYLAGGLALVGATDFVLGIFFLKGGH